jgi:hypothetical protein
MKRNIPVIVAVLAVLLSVSAVRAQKARWVKTQLWTGCGARQTEMFQVLGKKWRIRYAPHGEGLFQVAVYDEHAQLLDMATDQHRAFPLKGLAVFKGGGRRYLGITGADTTWTVVVEQYVTLIEEWHLYELLKQSPPELVKIGTWLGEKGVAEYTVTIPHGSWKIVSTQKGPGLFQAEVLNADGFVALAANDARPGENESWIHTSGTFTIKVTSDAPSWQIDVLAEP